MLGVVAIGAHTGETLERVLGGNLRMLGAENRVGTCDPRQLMPEAFRVGEAQALAVTLARDAFGRQARRPEVECCD